MPHSLVLIFGDTVEAAEAFDRDLGPDVPRIVLVDTFRDEAEEALRVAHALGDRLYGIRLDTPSERGRVTADLVHEVRARLDQEGYQHVRIVVSGGLDPDRIRYFKEAGAPVDSFAVGSYISGATPIDFTGDIKEIDGTPIAKRGRIPGVTESPRLKVVDLAAYREVGASSEPHRADGATDRSVGHHRTAMDETARDRLRPAPARSALLDGTAPRAGGDRPRAGRPAGAGQGLDRRGARSGVLQLRPARSGARDVRAPADDRPGRTRTRHFALGQSLKRLGRRDEAGTQLRLAVAMDPGSTLYRDALARLGPAAAKGPRRPEPTLDLGPAAWSVDRRSA